MAHSSLVELAVSEEIATITLGNPATRNALDLTAMHEINDTISALAADGTTSALIIRGSGGAFSSGASLTETSDSSGAATIAAAQRMIHSVVSAPFPIITAVDGASAGVAASLVFASDLTAARERSFFLLPFVGIGLVPDGGATITPFCIGRQSESDADGAAARANLSERRSGLGAHRSGLRPRRGRPDLARLAARCATTPRGALGATKAAINAAVLGHESSPFGNLSVALEREHSSQLVFLESPEHKESVKKFLSRRA